MKILYKPLSLIFGVIAGRIGRGAFKTLWSKIDKQDPPDPTTAQTTWPKVVGAAVLEAATMAGVAAVADRASAHAFAHLTGVWPGDQRPKSEDS